MRDTNENVDFFFFPANDDFNVFEYYILFVKVLIVSI